MSTFTKPTHGNSGRVARPLNSIRNLQKWLNRQAREAPVLREHTRRALGREEISKQPRSA